LFLLDSKSTRQEAEKVKRWEKKHVPFHLRSEGFADTHASSEPCPHQQYLTIVDDHILCVASDLDGVPSLPTMTLKETGRPKSILHRKEQKT
jgi:hypothetical protein